MNIHEISPGTIELIEANARQQPMELIYIGATGSMAIGNMQNGFRYQDGAGNTIPRGMAEPFHLSNGMSMILDGHFEYEDPDTLR